jgi:hypothetical protein
MMPLQKSGAVRDDVLGTSHSGTAGSDFGTVPAEPARTFLGLPPRVWARVIVLFCALAAIKVALLLNLGRHLNEIHWRMVLPSPTWVNRVAFLGFVVLGVWSLLRLAQHSRSVGLGAVRRANAVVLGLGVLFIFLTFHSGEKNYIYPIMTGILRWTSLGPYVSLDLFFRAPYLAAWLFGYAVIYYALVRTGREAWSLYVTAVVAGVYALLCLRELLVYRDELLVVDCLGLICLLASWRRGNKELGPLLLAPALWSMGFAWVLFRFAPPQEANPMRYFTGLMAGSLLLFGAAALLARGAGFLAHWRNWQLFYFFGFFLCASSHYPMAENYNNALCLGFELPRYFWGEAALAAALAIGGAVYVRIWPKANLLWLDIVCLALIAVAFVDLRLAGIMGVRLDWDLLSFAMSPRVMWRMAGPYLPGVFAALGLMTAVYAALVGGIRRWCLHSPASERVDARGPWYAAAGFVLLGALGLALANPDKAEGQVGLRLAQTSPWWKRVASRPLSREEFLRSAKALGLGDFAAVRPSEPLRPRRNLNVVLIFLESSYNKHLSLFGSSEETQPLLSKYKDRMELFPNFFSNFAGSVQAQFATFTSLYPVRDFNLFTLQRVPVKSIFEVMHDNGYSCSLFFSSLFDYAGFRDFIQQRGLEEMYDADNMPGPRKTERVSWGLHEEETLGAMRAQIQKYAKTNRRFFLTYVPAAPHYPFDGVPPAFRRFKSGELGDFTPFYWNDLLYVDWVMASIMDQLKDSGLLEQTLVVITDDHGERLGEHGGPIGHGWALTPELANVPLIVMDPEQPGYRINNTLGSQIDLLPTVLDLLGIALPQDQLYEGRSLYAPAERKPRPVFLNSYEQYGILSGRHYLSGARKADEAGCSTAARVVYTISNRGTKTLFSEDRSATMQPTPIRPFDEFQENLLRNYSFYCEAIRPGRELASNHSGR